MVLYHFISFLGQLIDFSPHDLYLHVSVFVCFFTFFFFLVARHCEFNLSVSEYFLSLVNILDYFSACG